ncbi:helix-turn-helix domain-containing protein [Ectobacillus polymachus]|uniref:AlbA family DNA-binding domain-containing protein n=1 Tax=Ectobacillus polymachus TaxID=1508806 RepID=UPI003A85D9FC
MAGNSQLISNKALQLLNKEEGYDVDFKRDMKGLKPEDLVSFANSPFGGTILVGVDEYTDLNGQQRGSIYGCAIGDKEKLSILSKAGECRPPVGLEVFVENEDTDKPFYRIEIPSGPYKPYCTNKGIYQIRGDGRNNPITPEKLLDMYLELQGSAFIERFKNATKELNDDLHETKSQVSILNNNLISIKDKLDQDMKGIWEDLENFNQRIHGQLDDISYIAENSSSHPDNAVSKSQNIASKLNSLANQMTEVVEAVNVLRKYFETERKD